MRTFGTRSRNVFVVLSWVVAIVALLGLLPWPLAAQTESDGEKAEQAEQSEQPVKPAPKKPVRAEATSGRYKITVDRVRREPGRRITMAPSGLPLCGGSGSQETHTETFPGGQATTSGGGMAGASGGVFFPPNLVLDVGVKGPKTSKKHQLICAVNGKVHAVDDQGHDCDSPPDPGWLRTELVGVEYRRGPGRTAIHLAVPNSNPPATYLKSVDGELLVADGMVSQFKFEDDELSEPTNKRANGISARLEKVNQSSGGIDVKLAVSPPKATKNLNPMANPMEQMKQMMRANAPGRVNVELVDSEGKTHAPTSHSQQSGGSSGTTSFGGGSGGSDRGTTAVVAAAVAAAPADRGAPATPWATTKAARFRPALPATRVRNKATILIPCRAA